TAEPGAGRPDGRVGPPGPVPKTDPVAANFGAPSSSAPTVTFGYSIRCSGGTRCSAGAAMEELRAPRDERRGAAGPVDLERGEDVGVLVESQEDERAKADEERAAQAARVLPGGEIALSLVGGHRAEPAQTAREERRPVLDEVEAGREPDAERPGGVRQEACDVAQHVVV